MRLTYVRPCCLSPDDSPGAVTHGGSDNLNESAPQMSKWKTHSPVRASALSHATQQHQGKGGWELRFQPTLHIPSTGSR